MREYHPGPPLTAPCWAAAAPATEGFPPAKQAAGTTAAAQEDIILSFFKTFWNHTTKTKQTHWEFLSQLFRYISSVFVR